MRKQLIENIIKGRGVSQAKFCRDHDISISTFRRILYGQKVLPLTERRVLKIIFGNSFEKYLSKK